MKQRKDRNQKNKKQKQKQLPSLHWFNPAGLSSACRGLGLPGPGQLPGPAPLPDPVTDH